MTDLNSVTHPIDVLNHFPVFFVGFNVRVECESLVKICEEGEFAIGSWVTTCKRPHEKHMLESKQSHARLDFASYFATQAKLWVTHETYCPEFFKCALSHSFTNTI